jgi:hypothetical protein
VAHAWLTSPEYQQLLFQAERRGEHPDQLAAMILKSPCFSTDMSTPFWRTSDHTAPSSSTTPSG